MSSILQGIGVIAVLVCGGMSCCFANTIKFIPGEIDLREVASLSDQLLVTVPGADMTSGNSFTLSFDVMLKKAYWQPRESKRLFPIVTLAPTSESFISGGLETLQLSFGQYGLSLMTHYKNYIRIVRDDYWQSYPKVRNRWFKVKIRSNGFEGLSLFVDEKRRFTLANQSETAWIDSRDYAASWVFGHQGSKHNFWLGSPAVESADVILRNISLEIKKPFIQVH